ncbi:hypothetical protein DV736_g5370, partial [Chaetothyriales sp. CBS 134916]
MTSSPHDDGALESWTADQEAALLRAIMSFKPAGMHKHFRMVAIRNFMLSAGVISADDTHTSTSGIWNKLGTLYDLEKLDEREDSVINDVTYDDDAEQTVPYWREFELPRDEFEEMMWERRLAPDGAASSPALSRRDSTVAETDEPRSSPVLGRPLAAGGGRAAVPAARGSARKSVRLSKLQNELETERSASRRTSKAGSPIDEEQETGEAEGDEEDEASEEAGEENGEEEEKKVLGTGKRETRATPRARTRRARRK